MNTIIKHILMKIIQSESLVILMDMLIMKMMIMPIVLSRRRLMAKQDRLLLITGGLLLLAFLILIQIFMETGRDLPMCQTKDQTQILIRNTEAPLAKDLVEPTLIGFHIGTQTRL